MAIVQIQQAPVADLAGIFLQARRNAESIGAERQRLAQQQSEVTARLQAESQQRAQERAVEQQRIAVTQAYHNQEIELRKQQLDEAAAMNQQKTQAAARAYQAKQDLQKAMDAIEADTTLSTEQKDAKRTTAIMRMGFMAGLPGSEVSSMITASRPPKPTVPATVTDKGDFIQVTQPNGSISIHPKPNAGKEATIKVKVSTDPGGILNVPASRARALVAGLPQEMADDPVNKAVLQMAPTTPYDRVPHGTSAQPSKMDKPVTKLDTPQDVKAAYQAGKITREQARNMLKDMGMKE